MSYLLSVMSRWQVIGQSVNLRFNLNFLNDQHPKLNRKNYSEPIFMSYILLSVISRWQVIGQSELEFDTFAL